MVSPMSSNLKTTEKITKQASKPSAKDQGTTNIGVFGLACSVIDLGYFSIMALNIVIAADPFTWGVSSILFSFGIILGVIGLVLGIVGAMKDENKSHDLVAMVAGIIAIVLTILI